MFSDTYLLEDILDNLDICFLNFAILITINCLNCVQFPWTSDKAFQKKKTNAVSVQTLKVMVMPQQ